MEGSIQTDINRALETARENEVLIGIDPESYLGMEILKQSREIISQYKNIRELKTEIIGLKKMTAEIINRLDKLKPIE